MPMDPALGSNHHHHSTAKRHPYDRYCAGIMIGTRYTALERLSIEIIQTQPTGSESLGTLPIGIEHTEAAHMSKISQNA